MSRLVTALALGVVALSVGLVLTFEHGRDQAVFTLMAREVLNGRVPYRDVFDIKPPGIFAIYVAARGLFGSGAWGVRVIEAASMVWGAWGLVRLSEQLFGSRRVGLLAAALAAQVHASFDFWHTAQPETFAAPCITWALVLAGRGGVRQLLAAGALVGVAGVMKPLLAGALVAALLIAPMPRTRSAAWLLLGALLPATGFFLLFAAVGALGGVAEVAGFLSGYTALSWQEQSLPALLGLLVRQALAFSGAIPLGLACLPLFRPEAAERRGVLVLAVCVVTQLLAILVAAKFYLYHWATVMPPLALLSALGLERAFVAFSARGPALLATASVVFGLAALACFNQRMGEGTFWNRTARRLRLLVTAPRDVSEWDKLATLLDVDAGENRAVARFIAENTAPDAPLFVWGAESILYDWAERPLASRFIYDEPQRVPWAAEATRAALMEELARSKPAAIVVEHGDVFAHVTGDREDSADALERFPALQALLGASFSAPTTLGRFDVYLRKGAPP